MTDLKLPVYQLPGELVKKDSAEYKFWQYYGFTYNNYENSVGKLKTDLGNIAFSIFTPNKITLNTKLTPILFVHGYLEHMALNKNIIEKLLDYGYVVYTFDLPGHGRSDGDRYTIEKFTDYGLVLEQILGYLINYNHNKFTIIGHSTGCTAIIQLLIKNANKFSINKIILVSPLIRSFLWKTTRLLRVITKKWKPTFKRRYGGSSRDADFLNLVKNKDFIGTSIFDAHWNDTNASWEKKFIKDKTKIDNKMAISIIQGTSDSVVDWKFNISVIKSSLNIKSVYYIEKGYHALFNDIKPIREKTFNLIKKILQE